LGAFLLTNKPVTSLMWYNNKVVTGLDMSVFKGGRGVKAPYGSKLLRVPLPIYNALDRIVERYKLWLSKRINPELDKPISNLKFYSDVSYLEAIKKARNILKKNKTKEESILILLTYLYSDKSESVDNK
jgi:hypothetical protein